MRISGVSPVLAALGVGVALAAAPGPVQAVLLGESVRGGVRRGLRALAGVHVALGVLVVALALGLSVVSPRGAALRVLEFVGGLLLLWLAFDAARSKDAHEDPDRAPGGLAPSVRGALAIVINPGGWLFLAGIASPLLATASERGGTGGAVLAAAALVVGTAAGDLAFVLLGGLGLRRAGGRAARAVRVALAAVLAALGLWLVLSGIGLPPW